MKKGEKSRFTIAPQYAYGEDGSPPKIPGDATLVFEIELIDFRDRTRSKYDYEPEERVPMGLQMKAEGNEAFKKGDLNKAKTIYGECIEFLDGEEGEEALTNLINVYLNMSLI